MKRLMLIVLVLGVGASLFAQQLTEFHYASGDWRMAGDRLYQNDPNAPLAKVNIRLPQSGTMLYEFNARYEDGPRKTHGGFGIHIFADDIYNGASWGSGTSYLLWFNYDENPFTPGFIRGLSAQVYRSYSNSQMDLIETVNLNSIVDLVDENLTTVVPVKIWVNGDTGEIRIYDPTDPDLTLYYYFYLPTKNLKGNWVSLRTNRLKLSFGLGLGM
jgi:hypothetical protein